MNDSDLNSKQKIIEDSVVLLEAATPEVYRKNSFRISGLPIDSTTLAIAKQVEKLEKLKKYGGNTSGIEGPFTLNPAPGEDSIREALQKLRDPERRMVDELFWFWPHKLGQSKNDEALKALAAQDYKTARTAWIEQENMSSVSNVSMHNLAVLSHLYALDLEYIGESKNLSEKMIISRDKFWIDSLKRWKILLEHEGFWSRFTERIRQMEDPRLTTGTARRIRESLPLALLLINAVLAVKAAEAENMPEVERHLKIIKDSGFEEVVVQEALRRSVEPVRKRIKTLCKSAKDEDNEPEKAFQNAIYLITAAKPLFKILDAVLPKKHPTRECSHDEVALTGLSNIIFYANTSENWKKPVNLLNSFQELASSESARGRIQKNIEIFNSNNEYDLEFRTCFFCKGKASDNKLPENVKCIYCDDELELEEEERIKQIFQCPTCNNINDLSDNITAPSDADEVEVKMYGDVKNYGDRITWQYLTVKVPRCETCRKAHARIENFTWAGGILGGLLGLPGCIAITDDSGAWFGGIMLMAGLAAIGSGIGYLIGRSTTPKEIKSKTDYNKFSQINELLNRGWHFGEKPSEAN